MTPPPHEHDCGWKSYAEAQASALEALRAELKQLKQLVFARKSEKRTKLPPPLPPEPVAPAQTAMTRAEAKARRAAAMPTDHVTSTVAEGARVCPTCAPGTSTMQPGDERTAPLEVVDFVRAHLRRRLVTCETLVCTCGHRVTAPGPVRFGDKSLFAPGFVGHLAVAKVGHAIPQNRLAAAYRELGLDIPRQTMCDLLHRAATILSPLYAAALDLVHTYVEVHADETPMRQHDKPSRAYLWVFVTDDLTVFRYAATRSSDVPKEVLRDSKGRLLVDAYTAYNAVTGGGGRERAGCWAHARRKLYEQRAHPEVAHVLELIAQCYRVEREAKARDLVGTLEHLALRTTQTRPSSPRSSAGHGSSVAVTSRAPPSAVRLLICSRTTPRSPSSRGTPRCHPTTIAPSAHSARPRWVARISSSSATRLRGTATPCSTR